MVACKNQGERHRDGKRDDGTNAVCRVWWWSASGRRWFVTVRRNEWSEGFMSWVSDVREKVDEYSESKWEWKVKLWFRSYYKGYFCNLIGAGYQQYQNRPLPPNLRCRENSNSNPINSIFSCQIGTGLDGVSMSVGPIVMPSIIYAWENIK